jgi:hypothetical protein
LVFKKVYSDDSQHHSTCISLLTIIIVSFALSQYIFSSLITITTHTRSQMSGVTKYSRAIRAPITAHTSVAVIHSLRSELAGVLKNEFPHFSFAFNIRSHRGRIVLQKSSAENSKSRSEAERRQRISIGDRK